MRKPFLVAAFLLVLIHAARAQVFKNNDLEIFPLVKDVWIIETIDRSTMYLIEGRERALLVDTGTKCDSLDAVIRRITERPLLVVLTHAHHDHAGNIGFFDEVYMHPADTELLQNSYPGKVHYVGDGYVFDLGDKKIEVCHMPAHTPGSIALIDAEAGICYSGDAFGSGQVWLHLKPVEPMETYIESCNRMIMLMEKGIKEIYCGHYYYVKKAFDIKHMIEMSNLAVSIRDGTVTDPQPFNVNVSISCEHPMIATKGNVSIVYDPAHAHY